MANAVACPNCKSMLRYGQAPAQARKVSCPKCKAPVIIPAASSAIRHATAAPKTNVTKLVRAGPPTQLRVPTIKKPPEKIDDLDEVDELDEVEEARPAQPRRPRDDDDAEDRPRRKRRDDADDEDDDRPRKKKKRRKRDEASGGRGTLIALLAGGTALLVGGVILILVLVNRGGSNADKKSPLAGGGAPGDGVVGGGALIDQHEALANEALDIFDEIVRALESVRDPESARAAAPVIERLADRLEQLKVRDDALPKIPLADVRKLEAKIRPRGEAIARRAEKVAFAAGVASRGEPAFLAAAQRLERVERTLKK